MIENGFIKIYRSMLAWEWYSDANTMRLFFHLLLTANYEDKKWRGIVVKRGQRVASYSEVARELKLSVQSVRTAVKHLIATGELTHEPTAEYGLFTVNNYNKYQALTDEATDGQQSANSLPTVDQQSINSQSTVDQQSANNNERKLRKQESKKARKQEERESIPPDGETPLTPQKIQKRIFGEFGKVQLSDDDYEKLVQRLGKDNAESYITRLDGWLAEGNTKKNHCATILNWWRKDGEGKGQAPTPAGNGWGKKDRSAGMIATSYDISLMINYNKILKTHMVNQIST